MADNVAISAGVGTNVAADEVVDGTLGTVKVQYVKIMGGALDDTTKAAVGANGLKVDPSGATSPTSNASASQVDGHSATIGATGDASSANTLVGLLKAIKAFFGAGLPAALVGGRLDVAVGAVPTLTKGTQGTTGLSVQDLKDAGRNRFILKFQAVAPATADTLLTMTKNLGGTETTGTTFAVTSGKTLRITSILFSVKSNAAAAAFGTMSLRHLAGAVLIGSPCIIRLDANLTGAAANNSQYISLEIPDGMEFSGTDQIGVSLSAQAVTNIISIAIIGYEY